MRGLLTVLGFALGAFGMAMLDERCKPTGEDVRAWLAKWRSEGTLVLDENDYPGGFGAGLDVTLPQGFDSALLLRSSGEWIIFHTGIGWTPADGYRDDFCNGEAPGAHFAPSDATETVAWEPTT